ncbi:MAG: response regulator transcription factor [Anaerolineae bacterium]|nr:response regulator transcription factor [Anaerolineae bacterium]
MIRVLICDDQDFAREGLQLILETDPDIRVVAAARDGAEAIEMVDTDPPDLVLMDLKMPGVNGIQATQVIRDKHPNVYVLVLTTYDGDAWVFDAIRSGASGYLLKDSPRDRLLTAIKETVQGKTHVDPGVAGKLLAQVARTSAVADTTIADSLSDREKDVLTLLAHGFTNTEIAQQLYLSEGTVKNYVSSIFTKLDVADRTQAALKALRYGLVNLNDLP